MFKISTTPIEPATLHQALQNQGAGACVTFEGRVRNQNDGRAVRGLEYEAYVPLAEKEGNRILLEACAKFPVLAAMGAHRTGALALGDLAVWVGVTAAHRDAAFAACRYIIDEAKTRLPVWKRELYVDGSTTWVNCATAGSSEQPPR